MDIDILIQSIIKTPEELKEEERHEWIKQPPPLICFQNRFDKQIALQPRNYKHIYSEYYWLNQRKKNIENKIKKNKYETLEELESLNKALRDIKNELKTVPNPHQIH